MTIPMTIAAAVALAGAAPLAGPLQTFEASGSHTWIPVDPAAPIVKKQGLEVTRQAVRESSTKEAERAAATTALQAALDSVIGALAPEQQKIIAAQQLRFDRWARSNVLSSSWTFQLGQGLIKTGKVLSTRLDESTHTVHIRLRAEIYVAEIGRLVGEQIELLDPRGKPPVLVIAQDLGEGTTTTNSTLSQALVTLCHEFGYPTKGLGAAIELRSELPSVIHRFRETPELILEAARKSGAEVVLLGTLTIESVDVIGDGATFAALVGQTRVRAKIHLIAVAADGRVLAEQLLDSGGLGIDLGLAIQRVTRRWLQSPPREVWQLLRSLKVTPPTTKSD